MIVSRLSNTIWSDFGVFIIFLFKEYTIHENLYNRFYLVSNKSMLPNLKKKSRVKTRDFLFIIKKFICTVSLLWRFII